LFRSKRKNHLWLGGSRMEPDESVIGLTGEKYTVDVEKRHVKQFAEAIGDPNPLYTDEEYASKSAYGQLVIPPTVAMAIGSEGGDFLINLDMRRLLHGEHEFIYYRQILVGDRLHCQMKIMDWYEKQGKSGTMQFLILDTELEDDTGNLVAISRTNIIYRPLKNA